MINILKLSTRFRSREKAYDALNEYIQLVQYLINESSMFEEVILIQ